MNSNLSDNTTRYFGLRPIHFELRNSVASSVSVAGSFNDWNPQFAPMTRESLDHWVRTIPLSEGVYEYCLVVDGEWILDPLNQFSVENPFGGRNSVFTVEPLDQTSHNRDAERQVMSGAAKDMRDQLRGRAAKACEEFATSAGMNSTAGRTCLGPRLE